MTKHRVPPQTNALYYAAFEEWATKFTNVKILSDQTTTNEVPKSVWFITHIPKLYTLVKTVIDLSVYLPLIGATRGRRLPAAHSEAL